MYLCVRKVYMWFVRCSMNACCECLCVCGCASMRVYVEQVLSTGCCFSVCVCVCVCMCVCVCECVCLFACIEQGLSMYVCICMFVCMCTCVRECVCVCVVCVCACSVCVFVCVYLNVQSHDTHRGTHVQTNRFSKKKQCHHFSYNDCVHIRHNLHEWLAQAVSVCACVSVNVFNLSVLLSGVSETVCPVCRCVCLSV